MRYISLLMQTHDSKARFKDLILGQSNPGLLEETLLRLDLLVPDGGRIFPPIHNPCDHLPDLRGYNFVFIEDNPIILSQYAIALCLASNSVCVPILNRGCDVDLFLARYEEVFKASDANTVVLVDRDIGGDSTLGPRIVTGLRSFISSSRSLKIFGFSSVPDCYDDFRASGADGLVVKKITEQFGSLHALSIALQQLQSDKSNGYSGRFYWIEQITRNHLGNWSCTFSGPQRDDFCLADHTLDRENLPSTHIESI